MTEDVYNYGPDGRPRLMPDPRTPRPHTSPDPKRLAALRSRFRMRRKSHPADEPDRIARSSLNALKEGFKRGEYRLPRAVRRYLRRFTEALQHRPRFAMAVETLVWVIGCYHTGERNFVQRGLGIGGEGAGFILCRQALARDYKHLTENLIRSAITFLLDRGFIERISPRGDLVEVRSPKNSTTGQSYFRRALKARKDALGRIRTPATLFGLGPDARALFAKTLRRHDVPGADLVKEPLWTDSPKIPFSNDEDGSVEGIHSGSAHLDGSSLDPGDPRFSHFRPSPDMDARWREHGYAEKKAERDAALAALERLKADPPTIRISAKLWHHADKPRGVRRA